jgi:SAM-dependent methyltransferase
MPTRKQRGAWYTPPALIDIVVERVLTGYHTPAGRAVRVIDPACGDGRFLIAVAEALRAAGIEFVLTGCDIDGDTLASIPSLPGTLDLIHADALTHDWGDSTFDVVIGNPPFLSQMAAGTTRGGSSRHGGGPYADAAAEFLSLAVRLADPDRGRVGLVLPQSILGARDAAPVRASVNRQADLTWSWWEPKQRHFDAAVNVCALGFERRPKAHPAAGTAVWTGVITSMLGIPSVDVAALLVDGTIGDRAELNANFRDEYYALVPAVSDAADGPPLVNSGLIDPGVCLWGSRPVTFAKHVHQAPRVDLAKLEGRFPAWARRKLVPKVLVANQTRVIEAVADPAGAWLPGVPVNTVTPHSDDPGLVWEIAAVLTAPVASVIAWHAAAGTGLSTTSLRVSPSLLGAIPWPAGDLGEAVDALRAGRLTACGQSVCAAYGLDEPTSTHLISWWSRQTAGRRRA